jgi:hypothetical protein
MSTSADALRKLSDHVRANEPAHAAYLASAAGYAALYADAADALLREVFPEGYLRSSQIVAILPLMDVKPDELKKKVEAVKASGIRVDAVFVCRRTMKVYFVNTDDGA